VVPSFDQPLLLFTTQPLTDEEAKGGDLPPPIVAQISQTLAEALVFDIVEGLEMIQVRQKDFKIS